MACNGVLTPAPVKVPPQIGNPPPVLKSLPTPPPHPQTFYSPLQLEIAASTFFTHGYFQQAHVNISEAIITN